MSAEIDHGARRNAVKSSRCPLEKLSQLGNTVLSGESTKPADRQSELKALKPVYYGAVGKVIDKVIEHAYETPAKPAYNGWLGRKIIKPYVRLEHTLRQSLSDSLSPTIASPDNEELWELTQRLHARYYALNGTPTSKVNELITHGAHGAALTTTGLLYAFTHSAPADMPITETSLRRSYGPAIELASASLPQIRLINNLLTKRQTPPVKYNSESDTLSFTTSPLDSQLDDSSRHLIRLAYGGAPIGSTIRDVRSNLPVIGCPVLLQPGQVQKLWNMTIDLALRDDTPMPALQTAAA